MSALNDISFNYGQPEDTVYVACSCMRLSERQRHTRLDEGTKSDQQVHAPLSLRPVTRNALSDNGNEVVAEAHQRGHIYLATSVHLVRRQSRTLPSRQSTLRPFAQESQCASGYSEDDTRS